MTDFAAAQQRILARRAAREAEQTSIEAQTARARADRFASLPPSVRVLVQHSLNAWDLVRSPYGTRPAFRVGQVDAELLDEELLSLLKTQAGEGLKLLGSHLKDDWSNEISLALRAVLWKLSVWDHGASYGASLQGLEYVDARQLDKRSSSGAGQRATATRSQRAAHGLLTVGGRYAWSHWEDYLSNIESGYDEPSNLIQRLSRLTTVFNTTHNIAAFMSFLIFLYNGRYRTLSDRLLRLRLVPSSNQTSREVSFEFLNRQLVWHAFTEFLLFILPLVGIGRWRRWIARAWKKVKASINRLRNSRDDDNIDQDGITSAGELSFLPERTCAICYQDQNPSTGRSEQEVISAGANMGIIGNASTDITNPYSALPCACIYCFVCLAQRIDSEDGEGWICLRCGENVRECRPWHGDVEEVSPRTDEKRSSNRKSIAWADEIVEQVETQLAESLQVGPDEAVFEIPDA